MPMREYRAFMLAAALALDSGAAFGEMRRKTVTRDSGGPAVEKSAPLESPRSEPGTSMPADAAQPAQSILERENTESAFFEGFAQALFGLTDSDEFARLERADSGWKDRTLEASYTRVVIGTDLTTDFQSPNSSVVRWNRKLQPGARGFEVSWHYWFHPYSAAGIDFGRAAERAVYNEVADNGLYARETVDTEIYWLGADFKRGRWLYAKFALTGYAWSCDTSIESNAPTFQYHGVTGSRVFGALRAGAGFRTYWRHPLQAYVDFTLGITTRDELKVESTTGHIATGLSYRY